MVVGIILLCTLIPLFILIGFFSAFYIAKSKMEKMIKEQTGFDKKQAEVLFKTYKNGKKPSPSQIDAMMSAYKKNQ
ncbi:MAG: YneF family protein [Mycoplasmataceae bacterium]|jgi:uncharacterized protein YneF (UPF0154 family)|nr:YneF family protein [Mycoplasmataceae bacterium]